MFEQLYLTLPNEEFISIFRDTPSPHFESKALAFENAIVRDALLIGSPNIIAINQAGRIVPVIETNPYESFLQQNIETCITSLRGHSVSVLQIGTAMSLCGDWADNFWHWWCEFLPYAVEAWQKGWRGIFVIPPAKPLFYESLAVFGIPASHIISQTTDIIEVNKLLLPRRLRGQYVPAGFTLFKSINEYIEGSYSRKRLDRRLYVARRSSRVVRNESVVFDLLRLCGYEKIYMEDYSISDQVALAHEAQSIIGPHGAGMTACLFMPPGGTVVEFFSPTYVNPCMLEICRDLSHRYAMVVSRIYRGQPYEAGDDIEVDMPSLCAALRSMSLLD